MDASSNTEMIKRYVEAFERKDWGAATAFWADDIVCHVQGRNPLAGDFLGKQVFLPVAYLIISSYCWRIRSQRIARVSTGARCGYAFLPSGR